MMFSLPHTFCLHFYLNNIHIFDYPDSRLSGLFTEVPTSPDNQGSTVPSTIPFTDLKLKILVNKRKLLYVYDLCL